MATKKPSKPAVQDADKAFKSAIRKASPEQRALAHKTLAAAHKRAFKHLTTQAAPKPKASGKPKAAAPKKDPFGHLPSPATDVPKPEYKPTLALSADRKLYDQVSKLPEKERRKWAEQNFHQNPLVATHVGHPSMLKKIESGELKFRGSVRGALVNIAKARRSYLKEEHIKSLAQDIAKKFKKD